MKNKFLLVSVFISHQTLLFSTHDLDKYPETKEQSIMRLGTLEEIKESFDCGILDLNQVDSKGYPFLHRACLRFREDIVEYLLEKGADVNTKTYLGNALVAMMGFLTLKNVHPAYEIILLLIKHGIDINCVSEQNEYALSHLINFMRTFQVFSKNGRPVRESLQTEDDLEPLRILYKILRLLLKNGAFINPIRIYENDDLYRSSEKSKSLLELNNKALLTYFVGKIN